MPSISSLVNSGTSFPGDAGFPGLPAASSSSGLGFGSFAGLSALNSAVNFGLGSITSNSSNKKAKRAIEAQFWMQNYFMDKMNEYNKPVNQMKRLSEAGLNPNLVYGSQNAVMESASPSGGGRAEVFRNNSDLGILEAINAAKQIELLDAQVNNIKAQTNRTVTQTEIDLSNLPILQALNKARGYAANAQGYRTELDNNFYDFLNSFLGNSGGAGLNAAIRLLGILANVAAR